MIEEGVVIALQDNGRQSGVRVEAAALTPSSLRKEAVEELET